jgi:hypothetical protein
MKTVSYCDEKIKELAYKLIDLKEVSKKEATIVVKSIEAYKTCRAFLLTNPSEEYITGEITKLEAFINDKLELFDSIHDKSKMAPPVYSKLRGAFEKRWSIPHKREQIHWMRLLIN